MTLHYYEPRTHEDDNGECRICGLERFHHNEEPLMAEEEQVEEQGVTLADNVMNLAKLVSDMKKMGIPYPTALDILRIALMFASAPVEQAAQAVAPQGDPTTLQTLDA